MHHFDFNRYDLDQAEFVTVGRGGSKSFNNNNILCFYNFICTLRHLYKIYTVPFVLFWKPLTEVSICSAAFDVFDSGVKRDVARMYLCCCSRYENH